MKFPDFFCNLCHDRIFVGALADKRAAIEGVAISQVYGHEAGRMLFSLSSDAEEAKATTIHVCRKCIACLDVIRGYEVPMPAESPA